MIIIVTIISISAIMVSLLQNFGSLQERQNIIDLCNKRIDSANEMLGRCQRCLYGSTDLTGLLDRYNQTENQTGGEDG